MLAAQFARLGDPADVVEVVELPEPGAPGDGEALVELEAAPINPSDLLTVRGEYGVLPPLPAVPGYEGTGRVTALGAGVTHLRIGDRVLFATAPGTWRERARLRADRLTTLPEGDPLQMAMVAANPPTAILLLEQYVTLAEDDWVIQNAANSGVGAAVIAVARERGLRTVNVVRRAEAADAVRASGGDVALVDGADLAARVRAAVEAAGGGRAALGLDSIGGTATARLARCVADGGTVVSYGALSGEPCVVEPRETVFRDVTLRGFWLVRWYQRADPTELTRVLVHAARLVATGILHMPVEATYPLSRVKEAVAHAGRERRSGKVLLTPDAGIAPR